ncbi:MAG: hypothetical protein K2H60_14395 [Muribaculaceae bacterium]|nr:hypothetical protein [Muribaculaceae bacterium]
MSDPITFIYKLSVSPVIIENGQDSFWRLISTCIESNCDNDNKNEGYTIERTRTTVLEYNKTLRPQLNVFQLDALIKVLTHPTKELVEYAFSHKPLAPIEGYDTSFKTHNYDSAKSNLVARALNPQAQLIKIYQQARTFPMGALKERMEAILTLINNDNNIFNTIANENLTEISWLYSHLANYSNHRDCIMSAYYFINKLLSVKYSPEYMFERLRLFIKFIDEISHWAQTAAWNFDKGNDRYIIDMMVLGDYYATLEYGMNINDEWYLKTIQNSQITRQKYITMTDVEIITVGNHWHDISIRLFMRQHWGKETF